MNLVATSWLDSASKFLWNVSVKRSKYNSTDPKNFYVCALRTLIVSKFSWERKNYFTPWLHIIWLFIETSYQKLFPNHSLFNFKLFRCPIFCNLLQVATQLDKLWQFFSLQFKICYFLLMKIYVVTCNEKQKYNFNYLESVQLKISCYFTFVYS